MKQTLLLALGLGCWGAIATIPPVEAQLLTVEKLTETPSIALQRGNRDDRPGFLTVDELSDVQPTDWAYQALKSIIDRYNLSLGYPDGTFRGNQPLRRYEFAAALRAALDQLLQLQNRGEEIVQGDLETLIRLQNNYKLALEELDQRLTNRIGPKVDRLQAQNFSPTTQLQGQFIVGVTDGTDAKATLVDRVRLNLHTRFNPGELLFTQLEWGNNGGDSISLAQNRGDNRLGTAGLLAGAGGLDYGEVDSTLHVNRLYYSFEPIDGLAVTVGAKIAPADFIDRNRFANNSGVDFNSSVFVNNPLIIQNQIDRPGGAGAVVSWDFEEIPLTLTGLYLASTADDAENGGLFGDRYQTSLELEYLSKRNWALRLQYTHAEIDNTNINAFGLNGEWALNPFFGVFGRVGIGNYDGFNRSLSIDLDTSPVTWAAGFNVRNWPIPGNFAGIAIAQPFISNDVGDATQTNIEAFYNLQLSDHVSLTPALILVSNADNDNDNGTIWQGLLRTVFSF